jgi:hypothetical protein
MKQDLSWFTKGEFAKKCDGKSGVRSEDYTPKGLGLIKGCSITGNMFKLVKKGE